MTSGPLVFWYARQGSSMPDHIHNHPHSYPQAVLQINPAVIGSWRKQCSF